jgi:hypothetical protein
MNTKICSACRVNKPFEEFFKNSTMRNGITAKCKVCIKAKEKVRYHAKKGDPEFLEKKRVSARVWYHDHKVPSRERTKRDYRGQRLECINHYGGKCQCCGEDRYEFLAIVRINGNGTRHRKSGEHGKICRWLIVNNFPPGFRILCYNCNMAMAFFGYCPHSAVPPP